MIKVFSSKKIEDPIVGSRLDFVIIAFLFFVLTSASTAVALQEQAAEEKSVATATEIVECKDNLVRDTPRSSFIGYRKATEKFDYEVAVQFMDLRNLPHAASFRHNP